MATGNHAYYMVSAYLEVTGGTVDDADDRAAGLIGVNRAYRRFLHGQHPSSPGSVHPWSFLRPMGSIQIPTSITGTITTGVYSSPDITLTASADKFTTGTHPTGDVGVGILIDGLGLMRINTYSSATEIIATGGVASFSDATKTFYTGAQIDMPADFGGLVTNFFYPRDSANSTGPLFEEVSAEAMMRYLQAAPSPSTPDMFALIPMTLTATVGQRYSVIFWPLSDADRVVQYRYRSVPADLTDSNTVYLVGGVDHSHTIEMAVRADAEFQSRNKAGTYEDAFQLAMMGSISRDATMFNTHRTPRIVEA